MKPIKNKKRIDPRYFLNETAEYDEESVQSETHAHRVQQASGVLSSKMLSLVDRAYAVADQMDLDREQTREMFLQAAAELQEMRSPSDNPVTKMVIEDLKFLAQPGVLVAEIGQAMTAFDE